MKRLPASLLPILLTVALVMRGLFPAGYMPGAGGAVQLCPQGLPAAAAALLAASGDHAHHHHSNHAGHRSGHHAPAEAGPDALDGLNSLDFERCSLGEALSLLALFDPPAPQPGFLETEPPSFAVVTLHATPRPMRPPARGPPIAPNRPS